MSWPRALPQLPCRYFRRNLLEEASGKAKSIVQRRNSRMKSASIAGTLSGTRVGSVTLRATRSLNGELSRFFARALA
jgi:hypothetical protein